MATSAAQLKAIKAYNAKRKEAGDKRVTFLLRKDQCETLDRRADAVGVSRQRALELALEAAGTLDGKIVDAVSRVAIETAWDYRHGYHVAAVRRMRGWLRRYADTRLGIYPTQPVDFDELVHAGKAIQEALGRSIGPGRAPLTDFLCGEIGDAYLRSLPPGDPGDLMYGVAPDPEGAPIHAEG